MANFVRVKIDALCLPVAKTANPYLSAYTPMRRGHSRVEWTFSIAFLCLTRVKRGISSAADFCFSARNPQERVKFALSFELKLGARLLALSSQGGEPVLGDRLPDRPLTAPSAARNVWRSTAGQGRRRLGGPAFHRPSPVLRYGPVALPRVT